MVGSRSISSRSKRLLPVQKTPASHLGANSIPPRRRAFILVVSHTIQIVWFKRDLRTLDHTALSNACKRGPVLPLFLVERRMLRAPDCSSLHWNFVSEALNELRDSFFKAEMKLFGAASPRISPLPEIRDVGNLATKVGLNNCVVDRDIIKVSYKRILDLFLDIKEMGETNAILERRKSLTTKNLFQEVEKFYFKNFTCYSCVWISCEQYSHIVTYVYSINIVTYCTFYCTKHVGCKCV